MIHGEVDRLCGSVAYCPKMRISRDWIISSWPMERTAGQI